MPFLLVIRSVNWSIVDWAIDIFPNRSTTSFATSKPCNVMRVVISATNLGCSVVSTLLTSASSCGSPIAHFTPISGLFISNPHASMGFLWSSFATAPIVNWPVLYKANTCVTCWCCLSTMSKRGEKSTFSSASGFVTIVRFKRLNPCASGKYDSNMAALLWSASTYLLFTSWMVPSFFWRPSDTTTLSPTFFPNSLFANGCVRGNSSFLISASCLSSMMYQRLPPRFSLTNTAVFSVTFSTCRRGSSSFSVSKNIAIYWVWASLSLKNVLRTSYIMSKAWLLNPRELNRWLKRIRSSSEASTRGCGCFR